MTTNPPSPTSPSASTCLLSGPLDDFLRFSGQEQSQWLIDIAHDVCDPAQKRGLLRVWDAAGGVWRDVKPTDPLTASIYLYDVQTVISLSKISKRAGKSKTSVTSNPSTMADRVHRRDGGRCWATGSDEPNTVSNSHICPRRMGDYQFRIIYAHFVSALPSGLPIDDESSISDKLGLRHVGEDQYECHYFPEVTRQEFYVHLYGLVQGPPLSVPLHGLRIKPPQPQHERNPPPGLFRWHYLQ